MNFRSAARTTKTLGLLALCVGLPISARATPTLLLFDSATGMSTTVVDEGAGDTNPGELGVVGFNGTLGFWTVNTSMGLVLGTSESPSLDLNSVNMSTAASTLTIKFSVDGFGPSAGYVDAAIGGTLAKKGTVGNSAISFTTLWNPANTLFSGDVLTTYSYANGSTSNRAFADNQTMAFVGGAPYSLTEVVVITHGTGTRLSSFDAAIDVTSIPSVPENGTTILLIGMGLAGAAALLKSRASFSAL